MTKERLIVVDSDILSQIAQDITEIKKSVTLQNSIQKEYLDSSEVKQMMKWSDSTFRRYCKTVAIHKIRGRVYIHRSDIDHLISRRNINPSPTTENE